MDSIEIVPDSILRDGLDSEQRGSRLSDHHARAGVGFHVRGHQEGGQLVVFFGGSIERVARRRFVDVRIFQMTNNAAVMQ